MARITTGAGRKSLYGATRAEVDAKLQDERSRQRLGLGQMRRSGTLSRFSAEWLEAMKIQVRPGTWRKREMHMRVHILPVLGEKTMSRITPAMVERLYGDKMKSLSPRSVKHLHATLRRAFAVAHRWGLLGHNIMLSVEPPRVPRVEMKFWDEKQMGRFLDAAIGHRLESLFVLALTTGMRRGEMLGLRWSDVDLDRGSIFLRSTLERVKGGAFRFSEPKTAGARRHIQLTSRGIAALRSERARQRVWQLAAGPYWSAHDLVFTNDGGEPVSESAMVRALRSISAQAGLPRIRIHDLRHTCFSALVARGIHPKIIAELAGHSRITVTMDTYAHVSPGMLHDAVMAMEAIVGMSKADTN